jgi:hypothetical protein
MTAIILICLYYCFGFAKIKVVYRRFTAVLLGIRQHKGGGGVLRLKILELHLRNSQTVWFLRQSLTNTRTDIL